MPSRSQGPRTDEDVAGPAEHAAPSRPAVVGGGQNCRPNERGPDRRGARVGAVVGVCGGPKPAQHAGDRQVCAGRSGARAERSAYPGVVHADQRVVGCKDRPSRVTCARIMIAVIDAANYLEFRDFCHGTRITQANMCAPEDVVWYRGAVGVTSQDE